MKHILILACASLFAAGCGADADAPVEPDMPEPSIAQGVAGLVFLQEGDFFPPEPSGTTTPVSRTVHIYPVWKDGSTLRFEQHPTNPYVRGEPNEPPVVSVESDTDGFYEATLEPGSYSVFVEEDGGWYCNSGGPDGACPVKVIANKVSRYDAYVDWNTEH